jgi:uncharacterized protein YecT (DUF1311 family)
LIRGILAIALVLGFSAPAIAADAVAEMQALKAKQAKAADAELNRVYQQLLLLSSSVEKKKLIQAEQAWIKYRDLECTYEAELGRGYAGLSDALNADCFIRLTRVRADELRAQVSTKQR